MFTNSPLVIIWGIVSNLSKEGEGALDNGLI